MIHALGRSFLSTLRRSVGLSRGRPRQQETVLAARSHSRPSGAGSMQHPQDRGCSMVSPTEGSAQPGQKDQPQRHKLRGDSKYYRLEFPHFEMCPKYFQLQSYWFFLLFLEDVLYCIQIHIWKRLPQAKSNFVVAFWLLGPKEGILHTQPTSLRSPDTHVESGWKT